LLAVCFAFYKHLMEAQFLFFRCGISDNRDPTKYKSDHLMEPRAGVGNANQWQDPSVTFLLLVPFGYQVMKL
jgi:hypothetical protein